MAKSNRGVDPAKLIAQQQRSDKVQEQLEGSANVKNTSPSEENKAGGEKTRTSEVQSIETVFRDFTPDKSKKLVTTYLYENDRDLLKRIGQELKISITDLNAALIKAVLKGDYKAEIKKIISRSDKDLI